MASIGVRRILGLAVMLACLGLHASVQASDGHGGGHGGGGGGHHGGGGGGHHGGGGHGGGGHHHGGSSFGIGFYGGYGGFGYGGWGYPGYGYSSFGYPGYGYPGVGIRYGGLGYPGYRYPGYRGYYGSRPVYVYPSAPRYGSTRRTVGRVYVASPRRVYSAPARAPRTAATFGGVVNERGEPTGELRPGMVLPDGSVVVSVDN